jgi:cytochrome P450
MSDKIFKIGKTQSPPPPKVRKTLFLGNALDIFNRPEIFLADSYKKHGPIYQIDLLGKAIIVLAGKEANKFAQRNGGEVFSHEDIFFDLAQELGSSRNMIALEGDLHNLYRKTAKAGYSRKAMVQAMQVVFDEVDTFVEQLEIGDVFEVFPKVQQLISIELGKIAMNIDVSEQIEDLQVFMRQLLYIEVSKIWPKWFKKLPRYRRTHKITLELANQIVQQHIDNPPGPDRASDLVDDFLAAHRQQPDNISIADVRSAALGPILAGQDTVAGTTAYMLYAILKHPAIYEQIVAEVDELISKEEIGSSDLRQAATLHAAAIETMRLYPVAPFVPQMCVKEFEFAGFRVPSGSMVYLAQSVIHFLEENFEDPLEFRLDREKATKPSDISPFGLGPHICIGAGMGEVQIMLNIARLLYKGAFTISPSTYQISSKAIPPSPRDFYVEFKGKR